MKILKIIVVASFLLLLNSVKAQTPTTFRINYGVGPSVLKFDLAGSILEKPSGNYLFCGTNIDAPINGNLVELDPNGGVVWANKYTTGSTSFSDVKSAPSSSYIVAGTTNNKAFLTNVSTTGVVNWAKEYSFSTATNVYINKVLPTSDGGYVSVAAVEGWDPDGGGAIPLMDSTNIYIFKTNATGTILWEKALLITSAYDGDHVVKDVAEVSDGYIFVGSTDESGGKSDAFVFKTNFTGTVQWFKKFGAGGTTQELASAKTITGGQVLISGTDDDKIILCKINSAGTITWGYKYTTAGSVPNPLSNPPFFTLPPIIIPNPSIGFDAFETNDGHFASIGMYTDMTSLFTAFGGGGTPNFNFMGNYIMKVNSSTGNIFWDEFYSGGMASLLPAGIQASDNGYVMTMTTMDTTGTPPGYRYHVVKTDPTGKTLDPSCYPNTITVSKVTYSPSFVALTPPEYNATTAITVIPVVTAVTPDKGIQCITCSLTDPTATATPTTICAGESSSITATGSGAGVTYNVYTASTGGSNLGAAPLAVSPTATTTYYVEATNGSCTSNRIPVTVTVNPAPTITIAGTLSVCTGGSTTLTASGGSGYTWSTGATTAAITISPAVTTTYNVTGTNGTCTSTATVIVTVSAPPTASIAGATSGCINTSVSITASGGASYSWSSGESVASITPTLTTVGSAVYTVTVSVGTCSDVASHTVTVNALPTITTSGNAPICVGNSLTLTAAGASTYTWNTGDNTAATTVTPLTGTTYNVTGTDANGCVNSTSVAVVVNTLPTITISGNTPICVGNSLTLTAAGASTYSWSTGDNVAATSVSPAITTSYTVTGTDANTCVNTQQITVTVNSLPNVSITGNSSICLGESTTMTAAGATTYSWNTGQTTTSIVETPITTTSYTVTGTDANSCVNTAAFSVTVITPAAVSISGQTAMCAGDNITLTASPSGATAYLWSTTETTTSIVVSPGTTTNYDVTVTLGTCSGTGATTLTVNPLPTVSVTGNTTICTGTSTMLTAAGASTYSWSTGDNVAATTVTPTTTTSYTVTGIDANTCVNTQQVTVTVNSLPNVFITGNANICLGDQTTLTASNALTYLWNTTASTVAITVTPTSNTTTYSVTGTDVNGCENSYNQIVTVTSPASVSITGTTSICEGDNTVLTAQPSGATGYLWNTGETTSSITVTPTVDTNYDLTVTVGICAASASTTVTVNTLPNITVSGTFTICNGESTTLSASGANGYSWSTGDNTFLTTVSPTTTTSYTVTGIDANTCVNTTVTTVTVNTLPNVSIAGTNVLCAGETTTLTASSSSAITYLWSGGINAVSITDSPIATTVYNVTGTDVNSCSSTASTTVTVNSLPVVTITGTSIICDGETTSLIATGGTTYSWNIGVNSNTISVSPTSTTTYTVTATDGNSCQGLGTVSVIVNTLPNVSITGTNVLCSGDVIVLSVSGTDSYVWSDLSTANSISVTPSSSTTYSVTATNANNCLATDNIVVTVNQLPVINFGGTMAICSGDSTTIIVNGGATYTWSEGSTGTSITVKPTSTTVYVVTTTDNNGCVNSSSVTISVTKQPVVSITNNHVVCENEGLNLYANGATNYLWSTGDTTESINLHLVADSTIIVVGNNNNMCFDSDTVTVKVTANPTAVVSNDTTIIYGQVGWINASGGSEYLWLPSDGLDCADCANPAVDITETTMYCVQVTKKSCIDTACVNVIIDLKCGDIFVPNAFSPNGDDNNDIIYVYGNCITSLTFEIFTRWGEKIFSTTDPKEGWDGTYRGKEMNTGVYTYVVSAGFVNVEQVTDQGNFTLIR